MTLTHSSMAVTAIGYFKGEGEQYRTAGAVVFVGKYNILLTFPVQLVLAFTF